MGRFKFGDIVENGWASDSNPTKRGIYLWSFNRTGRMNPGKHVKLLHDDGRTGELRISDDDKMTVVGTIFDAKAAEAIAAKDAEIANLTAALTGKFCVCFMDGINDHGTHVLPSFPRSVDCDFDVLEQAQAIWAAGEIEGFQAGDHIWCEFAFHPAQTGEYGQVEVASYWEFTRADAGLSRAINAAALKEQADA